VTIARPIPKPPSRPIGDVRVSSIGLGAMELSAQGRPDRDRAFATVLSAVEAGITIIDVADSYGVGAFEANHNERLVADALRACGNAGHEVLVATKGGHTRPGGDWDVDGRPEYLREACDRSLEALGVEQIGLYQHHRPDPRVPYEDTIGALKDLHDAGKIRLIGISNAGAAQIEIAVGILGVNGLASVQNEFSPRVRSRVELDLCGDLGIAFLAYSPLGGLGGAHQLGAEYIGLAEVAQNRNVSVQQVALAWELSLGPHVIPIPGCSRPATVHDCAAAIVLELDEQELLAVTANQPKDDSTNPTNPTTVGAEGSRRPATPERITGHEG
jgi:aryl-alcohol dehydrogenase-like predicted oxidoreductase